MGRVRDDFYEFVAELVVAATASEAPPVAELLLSDFDVSVTCVDGNRD